MYSSEIPTKPLGMLTHFLALINRASSLVCLNCQLPPTSDDWSILSTSLNCYLLLTVPGTFLLSSSSSLVGDLGRKPFGVGFAPKQRDPRTGTHSHRNECHPSCRRRIQKNIIIKLLRFLKLNIIFLGWIFFKIFKNNDGEFTINQYFLFVFSILFQ